jgi:hypothetical protein
MTTPNDKTKPCPEPDDIGGHLIASERPIEDALANRIAELEAEIKKVKHGAERNAHGWDAAQERHLELKQQNTAMREALERAIMLLDYNTPDKAHKGPCTPESGCDQLCSDVASYCRQVDAIRAALFPAANPAPADQFKTAIATCNKCGDMTPIYYTDDKNFKLVSAKAGCKCGGMFIANPASETDKGEPVYACEKHGYYDPKKEHPCDGCEKEQTNPQTGERK